MRNLGPRLLCHLLFPSCSFTSSTRVVARLSPVQIDRLSAYSADPSCGRSLKHNCASLQRPTCLTDQSTRRDANRLEYDNAGPGSHAFLEPRGRVGCDCHRAGRTSGSATSSRPSVWRTGARAVRSRCSVGPWCRCAGASGVCSPSTSVSVSLSLLRSATAEGVFPLLGSEGPST